MFELPDLASPSFRRTPESSLNMRAKHSKAILCPADGISELDSGVRRNDDQA
jgi:hypothetical protein